MKNVRKAVRTFLIDDSKVLTIKYTTGDCLGYYDIPGGKVENGETSQEAAIREFKEETGIDIFELKYAGNLIVEYPDRIYDFDVYITSKYDGEPQTKKENLSEWIEMDKLLEKEKRFVVTNSIDKYHKYELTNALNFKWHFISDENHNQTDEIFYSDDEPFWSQYYND